jgi:biofilm PGA synthesis N-glycosyltransferase PgaC
VNNCIPEHYGSTDGNIAMNIIKSGKRFLYAPDALIYEPVAESFRDQKLQKVRRAKRLIQVMLHNFDVFGNKNYGKFGTRLFPLKFLLYAVCPILTLSSIIMLSLFLAFTDAFPLQIGFFLGFSMLLLVLLFSRSVRNFFFSYVFHQLYLVIGLFSAFRKSGFWKTIDRKRNFSRSTPQEENNCDVNT